MARKIVLFGPKQAGKTFYLTSLAFYGENASDAGRRLTVLPATTITASWIENNIRAQQAGNWAASRMPEHLEFHLYSLPPVGDTRYARLPDWQRERGPSRLEGTLACWDVPGEFYDDGISVDAEFFRVLAEADAMMVLISERSLAHKPADFAHFFFDRTFTRIINYYQTVDAELGRRQGFDPVSRTIPFPVALCITQIDEMEPRARREEARGLGAQRVLAGMLGPHDDKIFQYFGDNYQVFGMTALGKPLSEQNGVKKLVGMPEPQGVLKPLEWIISQLRKTGTK